MEDEIRENIDFDLFAYDGDTEFAQAIVSIICDTVESKSESIRIGSEAIPAQKVRQRLMSLNYEDIRYVIDTLSHCRTQIKDYRAYTLRLLYYSRESQIISSLSGFS